MTARNDVEVSQLPDYVITTQAPLWWGQLLLAAIEGSLFLILIAMYFYMRLSVDVWPPPGIHMPGVTLPALSLIPLILSAGGSYWASEAAKKNDRRGMLLGLVLNLVLACIFVAFRTVEWRSFNFTWQSDSYGTIVWSIFFLHTLDTVGDMIYTLVLVVILLVGRVGPKQRLGVHVDSVVWYFIVIIWLPLYAVIEWGPRVIGVLR